MTEKMQDKFVLGGQSPHEHWPMLTIRPTKILARRIGLRVPEITPPVVNQVADWCAHEFRAGRFRYLIFCNTASLYPVVAPARGVTDEATMIERLRDTLKLNLVGEDLEFQFVSKIAPELGDVQWAPIPGRSILGSINEMIFMAKDSLLHREASPVELSRWLAESPMSALGWKSPDQVFPSLGSGNAKGPDAPPTT